MLLYLGYTINQNIPLGYLLQLLVQRCQRPLLYFLNFLPFLPGMLRPGDCGSEVFIPEEVDGGGDKGLISTSISLVVIVMAQWAQQLTRQNHGLSVFTGYYRCWNFQTWEFFPQLPKYQALSISFHIKWIIFYLTCTAYFYVL